MEEDKIDGDSPITYNTKGLSKPPIYKNSKTTVRTKELQSSGLNFDQSPIIMTENLCEPYGSIEGQQSNLKLHKNEQIITNNQTFDSRNELNQIKLNIKSETNQELKHFSSSNSLSSNFSMSNKSNQQNDKLNDNLSKNTQDNGKNNIDSIDNRMSYNSASQNKKLADQKNPSQLFNALGNDERIPAAMPLIKKISLMDSKEPQMYNIRRGLAASNLNCNKSEPQCNHEDNIIDWKCSSCNSNISKFNIIFDDNQGKVNTFSQIVYENAFLYDFKDDFSKQQINSTENGKKPIILYQAYHPSNTLELKEYMFMIISKKIKKTNKNQINGS